MAVADKNGLYRIGDLDEGTAVIYEYGTMDLMNPRADLTMHSVKGYVGPRHTNRGGKEKVVLMRTKTTGRRFGTIDPAVRVKLR